MACQSSSGTCHSSMSRARAQDVASRFIHRIFRCVPIVPSLLSESSAVAFKRRPRIYYAIIPFHGFKPLGGNVNQKWRHRHRSDGRNDTMSGCVSQAKSQFADCPLFGVGEPNNDKLRVISACVGVQGGFGRRMAAAGAGRSLYADLLDWRQRADQRRSPSELGIRSDAKARRAD